ncbi:hypothetical protein H2198_005462 [Neophaeococcomyces mojaviensis]|uniref:Uncharacterized protein n=1 Tax=Neophaeococcomyces mojaviensis TaxID=3383035 RepID=A0ACC3A5U0_9EURO|nr:hypothetical protein H2198_005462 [Knufia sp. JES_112]
METSSYTPPNHPIHNVKLSVDQIATLVRRVFPNSELVSYEQLSSGQSFNNRIYFLTLKHYGQDSLPTETVLKVIGRFFDVRKIQNEVSNLLLLKRHCPEIPAPEIVAWSKDTKIIDSTLTQPINSNETMTRASGSHKWVMMTKRPGRKLLKEDLLGPNSHAIATQLADTIASWRQKMPDIGSIGNFRINSDECTTRDNYTTLHFRVEGLLFSEAQPVGPVKTPFDYYNHLLANQINKLNTNGIYIYLRPKIVTALEEFRQKKLPYLPFLAEAHGPTIKSCFTHQDLSPRNILITDTPTGPKITGIVDFEFAGMFPVYEEYLNSMVRSDGDWPEPFWNRLLQELAGRGVKTPGVDPMTLEMWKQGCELVTLIENVAPWWLDAGHLEGEELRNKLDEACATVENLLTTLAA